MILGISALHHDSAVCLINKEQIVFASGEERFSRIKNDSKWPIKSIKYILNTYGQPSDIVFYDKLTFIKRRKIKNLIKTSGLSTKNIWFIEHHDAHAYSAIYTTPWPYNEPCGVMVVDTIGGNKATSLGYWDGSSLHWIKTFLYPNSLGLFYSSITRFIGFNSNIDENKTMSAAAFGEPKWQEYMNQYLINIENNNYTCLQNFKRGLGFGVLDFDIAASAQKVLEKILINLATWLAKEINLTKLVYSGGVALNCVANTRIIEQTPFKQIWIPPAAGDAGGALGGAIKFAHATWKNAYLGYDAENELDPNEVAIKIIKNEIVPVIRGRAEWGPRALGNRSFLALPNTINSMRLHNIKGRTNDRWRPWAPICLKSIAKNYFNIIQPSYEMMFVAYSKSTKWYSYPDNTARLQVVDNSNNEWLTQVLKRTTENGHPVLINTSLNVKGKPIINTYDDLKKEVMGELQK